MSAITAVDLDRMRNALFFEGPSKGRRLSRFWALLLLAAVIAAAGVISDSTATVIGAMIVAPLMTPILGTVLAVVTADRDNLVRSVSLVVAGALTVVAIGWLMAFLVPTDVVADTSSQVAGRVQPHVIDLVAALATGVVGAFALVRDDVGDTLPGVAIAISLVPPLAVVGTTLEAGATGQALGALLLFATNVAAILASGTIVMAVYRVHRTAAAGAQDATTTTSGVQMVHRRGAFAVIVALVVLVAVPLVATSASIARESFTSASVADVARKWATPYDWEVQSVEPRQGVMVVRVEGPLPAPPVDALRTALAAAGRGASHVRVELVPLERVDLPGS